MNKYPNNRAAPNTKIFSLKNKLFFKRSNKKIAMIFIKLSQLKQVSNIYILSQRSN